MQSVCGAFSAASPLLSTIGGASASPLVMQSLATCHQAMQVLPPSSWHAAAARTYARIVSELTGIAPGRMHGSNLCDVRACLSGRCGYLTE